MSKELNELREMQQRFNGFVGELKKMNDEPNPDPAKVDKIELELRGLAAKIETQRAIVITLSGGIDPTIRSGAWTDPYGLTAGVQPVSEETRAAFTVYAKTGNDADLRAMTTGFSGGGDTGGYLIPQLWENQILGRERELFVMRQLADVQSSASDRNLPLVDTYGASGWIKEGEQYLESDPSFTTKIMQAHKVGRICKVSEELLMDNSFNLENWLIDTFSYTNGFAMESAYFSGSGINQPTGFLNEADTVAAAGNSLTYSDVLELFTELKEGYFQNATWVMNRRTLSTIMKLKDDAGAYIYQPFDPKTPNAPLGFVLGRPCVLSEFMPDVGAGNKPVAFGDFKRYRIHDRVGFTLQRLVEKYADVGFIGFRGMQRTDGKLLTTEAIKVLQF